MSRLRVVPIVEGRGEEKCIRILLDRIWREIVGGQPLRVEPIWQNRGQIVKEDGLRSAIGYALKKLKSLPDLDDPSLVLILIDADNDCPARLGPELLSMARNVDPRLDVACVVVKVEYETWFAAAGDSLSKYLDLSAHPPASEFPEEARHGKAWVERRFRRTEQRPKYTETRDQPAMTSVMDLTLCRKRSPSFDKLCREMEQRMRPAGTIG